MAALARRLLASPPRSGTWAPTWFQCAASRRAVPGAARRLLLSLNRVARVPARRLWRWAAANTALPNWSRAKWCGGTLRPHSPFEGWRRRRGPRYPYRGPHPHGSNCKFGDELQDKTWPLRQPNSALPWEERGLLFERRPADRAAALSRQPVAAAARRPGTGVGSLSLHLP